MTTQTDADLWEVAIESRLLDVWTCLPGYVAQVYSDRGAHLQILRGGELPATPLTTHEAHLQ